MDAKQTPEELHAKFIAPGGLLAPVVAPKYCYLEIEGGGNFAHTTIWNAAFEYYMEAWGRGEVTLPDLREVNAKIRLEEASKCA